MPVWIVSECSFGDFNSCAIRDGFLFANIITIIIFLKVIMVFFDFEVSISCEEPQAKRQKVATIKNEVSKNEVAYATLKEMLKGILSRGTR